LEVDLFAKGVRLKEIQRMASWASRYSFIVPYMKAHLGSFYFYLKKGSGGNDFRKLGGNAQFDINLWRAILLIMKVDRRLIHTPMVSIQLRDFKLHPLLPRLEISFDASLEGMGSVIHLPSKDVELKYLWNFETSFYQESGKMNFCEFTAVVVTLMIYVHRYLTPDYYAGDTPTYIKLVGDNKTALSWALNRNFHSVDTRIASAVFMLLTLRYKLVVVETEHISSEDNFRCDSMSRIYSKELVNGQRQLSREPVGGGLTMSELVLVDRLVKIIDPTIGSRVNEVAINFSSFWDPLESLIRDLQPPYSSFVA
jgi:hypothetical protein